MRAVAIMMEKAQTDEASNQITDQIMDALEPIITQLQGDINTIRETSQHIETTADIASKAAEDFKDDIRDIQSQLTQSAKDITNAARAGSTNTANANGRMTPTNGTGAIPRMSYATVTKMQVPQQHDEVIARAAGRERHLLIDVAKDTQGGIAEGLSELELVEKANLTINLMGSVAATRPGGGKIFEGAQRLARGGVL
jgi:chromosome segregation ATPase